MIDVIVKIPTVNKPRAVYVKPRKNRIPNEYKHCTA